jgi:hypothetical protein
MGPDIFVYSLHEVDTGTRGFTSNLWEAQNKTQAHSATSKAGCIFTSLTTDTKQFIV